MDKSLNRCYSARDWWDTLLFPSSLLVQDENGLCRIMELQLNDGWLIFKTKISNITSDFLKSRLGMIPSITFVLYFEIYLWRRNKIFNPFLKV